MKRHATKVEVQSGAGVTIPNAFIYHKPAASKLMILLPGRGYTCDHPVMHYTRRVALDKGYDVLSLQYGFQITGRDSDRAYVWDDVWQAATPVLEGGYEHLCLVGKSLGTPLAAQLAREVAHESVSLILLTPVAGAVEAAGDHRTLAVIGTADHFYQPETVEATAGQPNIAWQVLEGLNHALEAPGDWQLSIKALDNVINACYAFLG